VEYEIEVRKRKDLYLDNEEDYWRVEEGVVCLEVRVRVSCNEEWVSKVEMSVELPGNMQSINNSDKMELGELNRGKIKEVILTLLVKTNVCPYSNLLHLNTIYCNHNNNLSFHSLPISFPYSLFLFPIPTESLQPIFKLTFQTDKSLPLPPLLFSSIIQQWPNNSQSLQ
jgi:hypothetical protein